MLQRFLIDEFVLNSKTGLGNHNVDGFYFDDGLWRGDDSAPQTCATPHATVHNSAHVAHVAHGRNYGPLAIWLR
jgi:hypothetical protein